jgi:hypothetical protein
MDRVEAILDQRVMSFLRELGCLIDLGGKRRDLLVGEVTDRRAERLVLF